MTNSPNTLERDFGYGFINLVCNHPSVHPWVASRDVPNIDLADAVLDRSNVLLTNQYGGFIFINKGHGEYEIHSQLLPEGRSKSRQFVSEAIEYMFECTPCERITTYIPIGNLPAKRLATSVDFKFIKQEGEFPYLHGDTVPMELFMLTKGEWQCQSH